DREAEIGERTRLDRTGLIQRGLLLVGRQFAKRDLHGFAFSVAPQRDIDCLAWSHRRDHTGEFAGAVNVLAVDCDDDVAGLDAGLYARTVRLRLGNESALGFRKTKRFRDLAVDGL